MISFRSGRLRAKAAVILHQKPPVLANAHIASRGLQIPPADYLIRIDFVPQPRQMPQHQSIIAVTF